jgi:hypothetical protein
MSYGLRIWDASGSIILNITDRLTRQIAVFTYIFPANSTGDLLFSVPGMTNDGTWFATTNEFNVRVLIESNSVRVQHLYKLSAVPTCVLMVFKA